MAGYSLSSAGDTDGDGLGDFLVGTRNSGGADPDGNIIHIVRAAFLVSGGDLGALDDESGPDEGVIDLDMERFRPTSSWQFVGEGQDYAGISVSSAGDVDGDGLTDLIIGASGGGADGAGAAYLVTAADLVALDRPDGIADGIVTLGEIVRQ